MQVESPQDILRAYANQVAWLERRVANLKLQETPEADPIYVRILGELNWCRNAHSRLKEILAQPKGYLVLVLKSKVPGLQGKVGKVTYVNTDHNFASVQFYGDSKPRNLGMGNLQIIDLPVPSVKIPAAGMRVRFKDDPEEYMAHSWSADYAFVEPMTSVLSGDTEYVRSNRQTCKDRSKIETIDGVIPL